MWLRILTSMQSMAQMMWHNGISKMMKGSESSMKRWKSTSQWAMLVAEIFMMTEVEDNEY